MAKQVKDPKHVKPPKRQPKQPRAIATTEAIIQGGFLCVAERSAAKTTTRHIAAKAGVGVGSLYEYFADKEAIFAAMNQRFANDAAIMVREITPQIVTLSIRDAIKALLARAEQFLNANDQRYLHYLRQTVHSELAHYAAPLHQALLELALHYVMRHPEYTQLRNMSSATYVFIHGGTFTVVSHLLDPNPPCSFEELSDSLAAIISHYGEGELASIGASASSQPTRETNNE